MSAPTISIVTPSFNQGDYLEETILSILNQNYPNLEYIIIDGGSTDRSVEIIKKYQTRLKYWVSEPDHGQAHAINKGFKHCNGQIITWINSDDLLCEGALQKMAYHFSANPEAGVIHGKAILFWPTGKQVIKGALTEDNQFAYFGGMSFPQPASFFSIKVMDRIGYLDEKLHYGMDYDFFLRAACEFPFIAVEDTIAKYRIHPSSKTGSAPIQFANDWCVVFSKFLRTADSSNVIRPSMVKLDLYKGGLDIYTTRKSFDQYSLVKIFSYFLYFQLVFLYESGVSKKVVAICDFLKNIDPDFYNKMELKKLSWRARFLPSSILFWLRKLKSVWHFSQS